jgi:hypothetical protein
MTAVIWRYSKAKGVNDKIPIVVVVIIFINQILRH